MPGLMPFVSLPVRERETCRRFVAPFYFDRSSQGVADMMGMSSCYGVPRTSVLMTSSSEFSGPVDPESGRTAMTDIPCYLPATAEEASSGWEQI